MDFWSRPLPPPFICTPLPFSGLAATLGPLAQPILAAALGPLAYSSRNARPPRNEGRGGPDIVYLL